MCEKLSRCSRTAKRDIECYKLVDVNPLNHEEYRPPYINRFKVKYKLNKVQESELTHSWERFNRLKFTILRLKHKFSTSCGDLESKEGLYSFEKLKDASYCISIIRDDSERILQCIIPKGARYFKTKQGVYISDKLKPIKEIPFNND